MLVSEILQESMLDTGERILSGLASDKSEQKEVLRVWNIITDCVDGSRFSSTQLIDRIAKDLPTSSAKAVAANIRPDLHKQATSVAKKVEQNYCLAIANAGSFNELNAQQSETVDTALELIQTSVEDICAAEQNVRPGVSANDEEVLVIEDLHDALYSEYVGFIVDSLKKELSSNTDDEPEEQKASDVAKERIA
jgi:hypothetical protein